MAITFIPSNEIGEVSLTSGTGTYAITGRNITNCFPFSDFLTSGDTAYFTIGDGAQLEWITGTYNVTTISRDIVWKSTSGGAAIDWPPTGQRFIRLAAASDTGTGPVPLGIGTVTNTGALTDHALIVGNGGVDVSALPSLGTSTTVLHGNATGDPAFGSVSLTTDASGTLQAAQHPALIGDVTSSAGSLTVNLLSTVNSNVGTFQGLTVNAKGLVTAAANQSYLTGNQTITLSGAVTGSGTTAITTTLTNSSVTIAGNVVALGGSVTATALTASLNAMTGANGSAGVKGLVPAPAAGDAAAQRFLKADGTWSAPSGAGNVSASGTLTANQLTLGAGGTGVQTLGSLGTTAQVLHGNAAGAPSFAAVSLTADISGTLTVDHGGTGAATLGAGLPLLGAGTSAITTGTLAGNTTKLATTSGSLTSTHLAVWDASGNLIDGGVVPSGGGGTVTNTGTLTSGAMILGNASVDVKASTHMTEQSGYYQYNINTSAAPGSPFNGSYFCSVDNAQSAFFIDTFAAVGSIIGRRFGGTNASKAATEANSTIFTIAARGYDTTITNDRAQIQLRSVNLWSGTDNSTEIFFNTTPSGSLTIAKRVQIKDGLTAGTGTTDNGIGTVTGESGVFDGSTRLYGTGNAFMTFGGPTTSTKTFTLPDASSTLATLSGTEQLDNKTLPLLNLGDPGAKLTIATGVITVTGSYHLVDTQAAAATDDLDTINGAVSVGHILVLQTYITSRDVTIKNATGNITLGTAGDCALTLTKHSITLIWKGSAWTEIARTI